MHQLYALLVPVVVAASVHHMLWAQVLWRAHRYWLYLFQRFHQEQPCKLWEYIFRDQVLVGSHQRQVVPWRWVNV